MKGMMGGAVLMTAVMAFAPLHIEAQMGARGQRGSMGRRGEPGVEHIMRLRERLELTEDQIGQLDAIRSEIVQHRTTQLADMTEFRSQMMAGQLEADEAEGQREARRAAGEAFSEDMKSRVESILTDAQQEEIGDLVGRARAFERGRASVQRGGQQGYRSGRGNVRGGQHMGRGGSHGQARGQRMAPQRMGAMQGRMMRRPGGGFGPPPPPTG